jgi:hypothetical protein
MNPVTNNDLALWACLALAAFHGGPSLRVAPWYLVIAAAMAIVEVVDLLKGVFA